MVIRGGVLSEFPRILRKTVAGEDEDLPIRKNVGFPNVAIHQIGFRSHSTESIGDVAIWWYIGTWRRVRVRTGS